MNPQSELFPSTTNVRKSTDQVGPLWYQPEMWTVPKDSIYAAIHAVGKGLEYARQSLIEHDRDLGRTTIKNKTWAEAMERDIEQMENTWTNLRSLP